MVWVIQPFKLISVSFVSANNLLWSVWTEDFTPSPTSLQPIFGRELLLLPRTFVI